MAAAEDLPCRPVQPDRLVMDQPGAGKAGERAKVDVALLLRVMAGDQAGQHPGIGGLDVTRDEREAHARSRPHPEALEHVDVGVPAPDQHQLLHDRPQPDGRTPGPPRPP